MVLRAAVIHKMETPAGQKATPLSFFALEKLIEVSGKSPGSDASLSWVPVTA